MNPYAYPEELVPVLEGWRCPEKILGDAYSQGGAWIAFATAAGFLLSFLVAEAQVFPEFLDRRLHRSNLDDALDPPPSQTKAFGVAFRSMNRPVRREAFETRTRRGDASHGSPSGTLARYRPQVAVSVLVVVVLAGGALYAARLSERAPQVVYSASLEEVEAEARDSLQVNINTADAQQLEELPEVGPATAESIIEYRRTNGLFRSVDELEEIPGIGPATIEKIKPFATV
jgi:competence protein ComEA